MRGLALMGVVWAASLLGGLGRRRVDARRPPPFAVFAAAMLVFAVGEMPARRDPRAALRRPRAAAARRPLPRRSRASRGRSAGSSGRPPAASSSSTPRSLLWPAAAGVNRRSAPAGRSGSSGGCPQRVRLTPRGEAEPRAVAGRAFRVACARHARVVDRRPPQYRCPACRASVRAVGRAAGRRSVDTRPRHH